MDFSHWDFFFLFATTVGMYALHRLTLVQEEGEVHEKVLLEHLKRGARRTLRNLSTVAGLRAATDYPLDTLASNPREAPTSDAAESADTASGGRVAQGREDAPPS